jgi:hypothetical protein
VIDVMWGGQLNRRKGRVGIEAEEGKVVWGKKERKKDSLFTNHFQIRYNLVMLFLDFVVFSVGFEFLDSFWGSVVDH